MELKTVTLVYFSPTGTTRKVLEGMAEAIGAEDVRKIDLTRSDTMSRKFDEISEGLIIFGAPVYAGRIPVDAEERFAKVKGRGVPAVVVAVYGNRNWDDALIEMREIAVKQGFKPVAAGAFIGEHSYHTEERPIAPGRPDEADIAIAKRFGQGIAEKLAGDIKAAAMKNIDVPGTLPLKERHVMKKVAPVTDRTLCMMCQICAGSCPTAAIAATDRIETDAESCILCSACVKNCPANARTITSEQIEKARSFLSETCRERKEPELFL